MDLITDFQLAERAARALAADAKMRNKGNPLSWYCAAMADSERYWSHIAADIAAAGDPDCPCEASLESALEAYNADHALSDMMARIASDDAMRARMITVSA